MADRDLYNKEHSDNYFDIHTDILLTTEIPTLIALIQQTSDLQAANILDVGCGQGVYLRNLQKLTSGSLYGVDVSDEMLKAARSESNEKIIFEKVDFVDHQICSSLQLNQGFFDVAISTWALCHAQTVDELKKTISNIANSLKKGGRFYGITMSPDLVPADYPSYLKYSYTYVLAGEPKDKLFDEDKVFFTVFDKNGEKVIEVPDYYFERATFEKVFREAGFEIVKMDALAKVAPNPQLFGDKQDAFFFEVIKV
jgi:SAM-dependent methyltransferase